MKVKFSLPTNRQFYDNYAATLSSFKRNSYFAQIVSAATEVGVIYLFFYNKFAELLTPEQAATAAATVAIFFTYFLETSLRDSLTSLIKQVLNKRWNGLHKWITTGDCIATIVFIFISGLLSFSGSQTVIAPAIVGDVAELSFDNLNATRAANRAAISDSYNASKTDVSSRYDNQILAIKNSYDAKVSAKDTDVSKYRAKENRTKKSYVSTIQKLESDKAKYKSQRAAEVAQLQAKKSNTLASIEGKRAKQQERNQNEYSSEKERITKDNTKQLEKNESQVQMWGLGFGWFSIAALIYLIYALLRIEIVKHGSGIEETPLPTDYDFKQGIISEWMQAITERWQRFWFGLIRKFTDATRPPLAPNEKEIPVLFDRGEMEQPKVKVRFDESEPPVVTLPPLSWNFLEQLEETEATVSKPTKRKIGFQNANTSDKNTISNFGVNNSKSVGDTKTDENGCSTSLPIQNGNTTTPKTKVDFIIYEGFKTSITPRKYSYSKTTSQIAKYKNRLTEAKVKGSEKAIKTNKEWVDYWQGRLKDFY
jgi:hypothetical protein